MIKKIIIGTLITVVLSLAATGTIYAYQKEQSGPGKSLQSTQSELPDAATGQKITADKNAGNYNDADIPCKGNRHRQNNAYRENEKNDNCEPVENNYSWEHNYNHKNENCSEDDCFKYNYKYEHNNRCNNSCSGREDRTSPDDPNQKRNNNGR